MNDSSLVLSCKGSEEEGDDIEAAGTLLCACDAFSVLMVKVPLL